MITEFKKVIYLNEEDIIKLIAEHFKVDIRYVEIDAETDRYYGDCSISATVEKDIKNIL